MNTYDDSLATLDQDGRVPETRMGTADECRNLVALWIRNDVDYGRAKKRANTTGQIQGNPPYSRARQIEDGRADAFNVNFRTAEAYEESAKAAVYDLFKEAETYTTVYLEGQDADTASEWSAVATEEFQRLQEKDETFDSVMQNSIRETVRFGAGPLLFPDKVDWHLTNVPFEYLLVPDDASSIVHKWETCAIRTDLLAHELYKYIRNPKAAEKVGWDVESVKAAIINAAPINYGNSSGTGQPSWEFIQQQLKQSSFSYSARSKVIQCVHFFAREFQRPGEVDGKISHAIFVLSPQTGQSGESAVSGRFLYQSNRVYDEWTQIIHPMYYSQGEGGKHYGVTGQGVKMYGVLSAQNLLLNNACDKAFAPKIMFKPGTPSGKQRALTPSRKGDYMVLPDGWDLQQVATGSMIDDQVMMNRELSGLLSANLSTYRQNLEQPKSGNPITAKEVEVRGADQARMGKTQLNRYYEQLDWLYEERYRRACNPKLLPSDPGGKEALEFQKKCQDRGVPREELLKYCSVKATRVTGQGSPYLRQQALQATLVTVGGRLPEDGLEHLTKDLIAAMHGQYLVGRYFPTDKVNRAVQDQLVQAALQVASMKEGVPAVLSPSQNPMLFAQTFMQAASQALASLQQVPPQGLAEAGSNVLAFLDLAGPAIATHLQRMSADPARQQAVKVLGDQFKKLTAATDQLRTRVQQAMQAQQEARKKQAIEAQQLNSKMSIDARKAQAQIELKVQKQQVDSDLKRSRAQTDAALSDATTASGIVRSNAEVSAAIARKNAESSAAIEKMKRADSAE